MTLVQLQFKGPSFTYLPPIQDIVVMKCGTKPLITPTYMQNIRPLEITYTVNIYEKSTEHQCL